MLRFDRTMALVSVVFAVACGKADVDHRDAGALVDAAIEPSARLTLESADSMTLLFGESAELSVRYTEEDGTPIAGATLGLALVGRAHDSTLDALETVTDADGLARGRVIAGTVSAAFRVRVTAPRALPVEVEISIGNAGFGGLLVRVDYDGERLISERAIDVYGRGSCDDPRTTGGPGDRSQRLAADVSEARFFALPVLPPGESYAVLGKGRGPSGELLTLGCTDGVIIEADGETTAGVVMRDLELVVDGTYSVEAALDATDSMSTLAATMRTAGNAPIVAAGGDASFLLDALESSLRAAGSTAAANDLAMQRTSADLDAALALRLDAAGAGPSVSVEELATVFAERTERLALGGALDVADALPTWTMAAVSTRASEATSSRLPLDLSSLGVAPDASMNATWLLSEDAMQLDELRVTLPLGSVGVAVLSALASEARVDGPATLMLPTAGCTIFQTWATEQSVVASACDRDCLQSACKNALEEVTTAIESALVAIDAMRAIITLMGRVSLSDTEGDLRVDAIRGEALTGAWTADGTSPGDPLEGVLNGARVID